MIWWVKVLICVAALIVAYPLAYFHAAVVEEIIGMKSSPLSCMATYFVMALFYALPKPNSRAVA